MTRHAPLWYQAGSYTANEDQMLLGALFPSQGFRGMVPAVSPGTMNLTFTSGVAAVAGTGAAGLQSVLCASDAVETVTISPAPSSGQTRIDIVTVYPNESSLGWTFNIIQGTAATTGSQVAPTVPAGQAAVCSVSIPGGVANLNTATLVDLRPRLSVGDGDAWQPITLASGWAPLAGYAVPGARMVGNQLRFRGRVQNTTLVVTSGGRAQFGTLNGYTLTNRLTSGEAVQVAGGGVATGYFDAQVPNNLGAYAYSSGTGLLVNLDGLTFDLLP